MSSDLFLAADLGTSSLKTVAFDAEGTELWSDQREYPLHERSGGRVEHDPADWERALADSVANLPAGATVDDVAVVAVTGLSPGFVPLDDRGEPVCPAVLPYLDSRAEDIDVGEVEGLPYTSVELAKYLVWLRRTRPNRFAAVNTVATARNYLGYLLTGNLHRDGFLYPTDRIDDLCAAFDLPPSIFPDPHDVTRPVGTVTASVRFDLRPDTAVIVGPFDGMCAVLGSGLHREGRAMSVGGSTTINAVCLPDGSSAANMPHILDGLDLYYTSEAVGTAHRWLAERIVGGGDESERVFADLDERARSVGPGDLPVFVPLLHGERTNPSMRGGVVGLSNEHGLGHLVRSVYEGTSFYLREILETVSAEAAVDVTAVTCSGGATESNLWNRVRANVTGTTVVTTETTETPALGAAMLAAAANGPYDAVPDAIKRMTTIRDRHEPDGQQRDTLEERYRRYQELYAVIDDLY